MADSKITALTALTAADPANDMIPIVDVSDTPPASGNTKRISINNILACSPSATLASATITGDLTVRSGNKLILNRADNVVSTQLNDQGSGIGFVLNNVNGDGILFKIAGNSVYQVGSSYTQFWYDGAGGTRMTLNSTGLGIGAVPSAYKLHVAGTGYFSSILTLGGASRISAEGSNALNLNTNSVDRLTIDSTGNVGIGVTPSAWGSGLKALQVGARGYGSFFDFNNDVVGLTSNLFWTGSAYSRISASSKYAVAYYHDIGSGAHQWLSSSAAGTNGVTPTMNTNMTLDASGNLLVGFTSNPNTARAYFRYDTLTTQPVINSASVAAASTSWSHFIGQSGNGSSITTSNIFIYGNGNIQNVNGVYGTISDLRLKENIADARNYLSDLLKLRVVKYSLKEEASAVANKLGFIAQEVEQVFPAMVDTDPNDGNKGIKTSVLIPMLVKAIQELTARVQTLEAK